MEKTTELTEQERALRNNIFHFIKDNEGYIKSAEIQKQFGITGVKVRECIHDIRVKSYPIISDNNGYKFARTASEIEQCIAQLYSRVQSIAEAARGLVGSRDRFFSKQQSLEFEIIEEVTEKIKVLNNDHLFKHQ